MTPDNVITDDLPRACVLGFPVSQSLSPRLHSYWLDHYGIPGAYTSMAVPPAQLKNALDMLAERGFKGCNLTIPLKEGALSMMDDHDESCLMSGAVNTVVFEGGKKRGFNSDGFGFLESLKAQAPAWQAQGRVVILGTGGAARGIIASLKSAGIEDFAFVNRTVEKAERVNKQFKMNAEVFGWDNRADALKNAGLLINCTSLGMAGQDALDMPLDTLPENAVVADIVYKPLQTPLLRAAQSRGHVIVEGLPMLLHQGRLGFDYWFGRDPEVTGALYDHMVEALESKAA